MPRRTFGFSWSWKRAAGLSGFKSRLSRRLGIPLTRYGRQRRVGAAVGCCVPLAIGVLIVLALAWL